MTFHFRYFFAGLALTATYLASAFVDAAAAFFVYALRTIAEPFTSPALPSNPGMSFRSNRPAYAGPDMDLRHEAGTAFRAAPRNT